MNIRTNFGRKVKEIREKRGWSQDFLAEKSGLHRTYISGIERGVRNPTLEIIFQLSEALEVSIPEFFQTFK